MCRLGSAWKPRLRPGFFRLRPLKIEAQAVPLGLGQLGLSLGLGRGFCLLLANTEESEVKFYLLVYSLVIPSHKLNIHIIYIANQK